MKYLRDQGHIAEVAEHRVPRINITRDLFGFVDIAVLDGKPGVLGVQTTTMSNHAARVGKIQSDELARAVNAWLLAGNRIVVHGWAKRGPRGKRKRWSLVETPISTETISAVPKA